MAKHILIFILLLISIVVYADRLEFEELNSLHFSSLDVGQIGAFDYLNDGTGNIYMMKRIIEDNQINWYMVIYAESGEEQIRILLHENISETNYMIGSMANLSQFFVLAGNQYVLVPHLEILYEYASQHFMNEADLVFDLYSFPDMTFLSSCTTNIINILRTRPYEFTNLGNDVLENQIFVRINALAYFRYPNTGNARIYQLTLEGNQLVFENSVISTFQMYSHSGQDEIVTLNRSLWDDFGYSPIPAFDWHIRRYLSPDLVEDGLILLSNEFESTYTPYCMNSGFNQNDLPIFAIDGNIEKISPDDGSTVWSVPVANSASQGFCVDFTDIGSCIVEYTAPNFLSNRDDEPTRITNRIISTEDGSIIEEYTQPTIFKEHIKLTESIRYLITQGNSVYKLTIGGIPNDDFVAPPANINLSNYPNPFNPETTISYDLAKPSPVSLGIYNIKGQHVRTLVNEPQHAGSYEVLWSGKDANGETVGSGIYLYRLKTNKQIQTGKAVLLK
ncbi:MAG: T9SS type A sorting domain-containing protein [Candidatus Cloacimonetes bacterium]|nr:T9SS type A sorting domain-containing protein [Candidatus Cloacimonadota bacterium]